MDTGEKGSEPSSHTAKIEDSGKKENRESEKKEEKNGDRSEIKLLPGETIRLKTSPHPLSFTRYYLPGVLMLIFSILFFLFFFSSIWGSAVTTMTTVAPSFAGSIRGYGPVILWGIFIIVYAILTWRFTDEIGGLLAGLYLFMLISAAIIEYFTGWDGRYFIPAYMGLFAILMMVFADLYRRAFRYYITDMRIAIVKRFLTHDEIFLRYRNIVDLDVHQGVWARIIGFGNIIPITSSGIGTGTDAVTIRGDAEKGELLEKGIKDEQIVSTTRSVYTGRANPDECLFGVKNPFKVKTLVAELIDAQSEDTQLKEIRALLEARKAS